MKVLHVAETIKGGVATVLNQLNSDDRVKKLFLIPLQHSDDMEIKENNILFNRTGRNIFSFLRLAILFIQTIINFKPDIIHIHSSFAGLICRIIIVFFPNRPKVIYCPHAFSFLMSTGKIKKIIYAFIENILSHITDMIICTSNFEKKIALEYLMNSEKMVVIYNGIKVPLVVNEISPYKKKNNVLFVGRFDYQKAFDFVLKVSNYFPDNIELTIVGEYVNDKNKKSIPNSINHIPWLNRESLSLYYYYADVVFMPSRWESFGLVAVEANSYGTPVVCSNRASLPEIVIDNFNGKTFDHYDPEMVSKMIIEIINSPMNREIASNCISVYKNKFTSELMQDRVFMLYKNLLPISNPS